MRRRSHRDSRPLMRSWRKRLSTRQRIIISITYCSAALGDGTRRAAGSTYVPRSLQLSQFGGFCFFPLHYDDAGCEFTSNHGNRFMPMVIMVKMPEPEDHCPSLGPSVLATRPRGVVIVYLPACTFALISDGPCIEWPAV